MLWGSIDRVSEINKISLELVVYRIDRCRSIRIDKDKATWTISSQVVASGSLRGLPDQVKEINKRLGGWVSHTLKIQSNVFDPNHTTTAIGVSLFQLEKHWNYLRNAWFMWFTLPQNWGGAFANDEQYNHGIYLWGADCGRLCMLWFGTCNIVNHCIAIA